MTRRTPRWLAAGLLLALGQTAQAQADGAALYQARCAACHGPQALGQSAVQAPPLAGQDEAYLLRQLQHLRRGIRGGSEAVAAMQAVAQALPDEAAVAALARHLARLKPPTIKTVAPAPGTPQMAGKGLYTVCMACHGSGGEGNAALGAPRLNMLPAWYTVAQLQAYRSERRGAHADDAPGQQMRQIAREALSDEEDLQSVASYIATLGTGRR